MTQHLEHVSTAVAARLREMDSHDSDLDIHVSHCGFIFPKRGDKTMKAAYFEQHGGPEVLKYGDLPDPVARPGEVLVDIHAASVNSADWQVRLGRYGHVAEFPHILGRDFSGVVSAVADGVTDFKVGDAVFGVCETGQEGAYAEMNRPGKPGGPLV